MILTSVRYGIRVRSHTNDNELTIDCQIITDTITNNYITEPTFGHIQKVGIEISKQNAGLLIVHLVNYYKSGRNIENIYMIFLKNFASH
jgi:hypothetical protein